MAGYDLITKAKLVIDSSNRCVWSYYTSTPQGMPTCSSSSAIDAGVHCFTTTVIDSILQDLTPAVSGLCPSNPGRYACSV